MDAPAGSLIVYATAPGGVAEDGDGRNGVFTENLLKHLGAPGLDAELMLRRVRKDVVAATSGAQVPWTSSSLQDAFSFAGAVSKSGVKSAPVTVVKPTPKPKPKAIAKPVFVVSVKGSSDDSNPISRRVFAEKDARRKLKRAVLKRLTKSPYSMSRDKAQEVYEAGEELEFYYENGGKSVVLEYEFDTRTGD